MTKTEIPDRTWRWALIGLGLAAFGLCATIGVVRGWPEPDVPDELCYLLQGETFSKFHLAMPHHPLWKHFQSFFLIHDPVYASKYPPGQGVALAIGFVLGHPAIGLWLSIGALGLSMAWMLAAFVPRRWALFGGCLVLLGFGFGHEWAQTYWGGAVAGIGGALLFGGFKRFVDAWRPMDGAWMGLGLAVLANSRPYEGLVVAIVPLLVLATFFLLRLAKEPKGPVLRSMVPLLGTLLALTAWTGVYNARLTGDPMMMPYSKHHAEYPTMSLFAWQKLPKWKHKEIWVWNSYRKDVARGHFAKKNPPGFDHRRVARNWRYARASVLPNFLLGGLLLAPFAFRRLAGPVAGFTLLLLLGAHLVAVPYLPHYSAPGLAALVLLVVAGLFELTRLGRLRYLSYLGVLLVSLSAAHSAYSSAVTEREPSYLRRMRPRVLERILEQPGRHVVLVRYHHRHNPHLEWVYNGAEIDSQAVIWAHDLGDDSNRQLLEYYSDRTIWRLEVGAVPEFTEEPSLEKLREADSGSAGTKATTQEGVIAAPG
ncbi:MAG: hypothetical protein GY769_06465 [bacterium]|nr:hypothetical protein [bacterium]